ncbi:MAG: DNA polymerase III subunit chi, partial [Pseudomonadota bacterium]
MASSEDLEVRFYHLQRLPLERALTMILMRVVNRGQRAVVVGGDAARLAVLDGHLWAAPP